MSMESEQAFYKLKAKLVYPLRAIIVFVIIILGHSSFAQTYTLSPEKLDDAVFTHVKVIGQDEGGFYLLQSNLSLASNRDRVGLKNRKYKISYYDFNMIPKWNKALLPFEEGADVEGVVFFNNRVLVLQSQTNKGEGAITFFADVYNNTGYADKKNVRLAQASYNKSKDVGKVRMITSASRWKAALYFDMDEGNVQQVQMIAFDTALAVVSQQRLNIPYDNKTVLIAEYALSEQADFVSLVQINNKNSDGDKKRLLQYHLFVNRVGQSTFEEFAINAENKPMTEAALAIDNLNGNAVVTGFYADKNSGSGAGIMYASLSLKMGDSLKINAYSIKGDTQLKLIGERNEESNFGLFSYPIQRIILRADGGSVIIAEAAYTTEYSYYDYFTQSFNRRTEYHFDNVVVLSINARGEIDWSHVLRKNQQTIDDGGFLSSFVSVLSDDRLAVIYNNDISRNNEVVSYAVSAKGELTQSKIIRSSERIFILPRAGKQVDNETLIVPGIFKKRMYLVKIKV